MSRIEQALEKAIQNRESASPQVSTPDKQRESLKSTSPLPVFQIKDSIIDPSLVDRHIVCIIDPISASAEQYRKLKGRILATTKQDFQNTVMVSSADVGEGKSITAINFAVALAQEIDHTVLLIDADLRMPSIHKYLGITVDRGLSDYLAGTVELSDVLIHTGIGKLVLLPAGNICPNPAELLSSNRMTELVHELKHRYVDRYIVIDTPPILVSSDAISISMNVDGVIIVVAAAKTSEKTVKRGVNLIKNAPILGIVYNNVPLYLGKNLHPYNYYHYNRDNQTTT
ncbi:MAG: XrtA-associated tyrosine autokinase [Dissulfurispiraceae bacterium]